MAVNGTIQANNIEQPLKTFKCKVKRHVIDNNIYQESPWEEWRVLAETKDGAKRIAEYHFFRAHKIVIIE